MNYDDSPTADAVAELTATINRLGGMIDPIATDVVHALDTIASNLKSIALTLEGILGQLEQAREQWDSA